MTGYNADTLRSAVGEHLVVLLIIATVLIGAATTLPMLESRTAGTAAHVDVRLQAPIDFATALDAETASPSGP